MLNQDQILKKNKTDEQLTAASGKIAPLQMQGTANTTSNRMKELRKPRSRQYINDLVELQGMLMSLDRMKKEMKVTLGSHDQASLKTPFDIVASEKSNNGQTDRDLSHDFTPDSIPNIVLVEEPIHNSYDDTKKEVQDNSLINSAEIEALEKSIEEKLRKMEEQYPLIRERLSMIFPESEEEYLIGCGAIQGPGRPVYDREDMAVNVHDPKVAEQLKRGYDVYKQYRDTRNFLCVEIYIDAFCVIYKDGIVKTVE